MKKAPQTKKGKTLTFSIVFAAVFILLGLYGLFTTLTGGRAYRKSSDVRVVDAVVTRVEHSYRKDDDGDITDEKWKATLSFTVDGKTYTGKKTFGTKTYSGETVSVEVYRTAKGDYKLSSTNTFGFILSVASLVFGGAAVADISKTLSGGRKTAEKQTTKAKKTNQGKQ